MTACEALALREHLLFEPRHFLRAEFRDHARDLALLGVCRLGV
jgi:hypothetical protein